VTVRDWIAGRSSRVPRALTERILSALGDDAEANESRTGELCLAAAARSLDGLLTDNRHGRDGALDLLAIDALTTYSFEHASQSGNSAAALRAFADRGSRLLGQLVTQRV
jgi:hypothetical protein